MRNPFRPLVRMGEDQVGYLATAMNSTIRKLSTLGAFGVSHDGARDLKVVYGYPTEAQRTFDYYWSLYKYQDYATRVVNALPRSCWRDGAELKAGWDDDDAILEDEMNTLDKAGLFRGLEAADILNRIGSFSVLYVGVPDGKDPKEPIDGSGGGKLEDVYFSPYSEPSVTIADYDKDPTSPRYGLPILYTLTPNNLDQASSSKTVDTRESITVHWTRVVHLAEGALSSPLIGSSALAPVANRLVDLNKTMGGAGEAYFRNAERKWTLEVDRETTLSKQEMEALDEGAQGFLNGWKSIFGVRGSKMVAHQVQMISPKDTVTVALQAIAGATGYNLRMLTGEGAGQYAGNEEKASYNQIVSDRQKQECAGWLESALRPIDAAGLIKLPDQYVVTWPLPEAMDEAAKADVELKEAQAMQAKAQAIATYGGGPGADHVVPPDAFRTEVLKMDPAVVAESIARLDALD